MKGLTTIRARLTLPLQALVCALLTLAPVAPYAPGTPVKKALPPLPPPPATSLYGIRESGTSLEITGPGGVKVFSSDVNFSQLEGYQARIPLALLAPPPPPPTPAAKEEDDDEEETVSEDELEAAAKDSDPKSRALASITVEYDDSDRMLVEANHLYNRRKYFQATEIIEELLRKKPKRVRGWIMKGSLLYVQGHKDLAKQAWTKASELEPANPDIQHYLERYK